MEPELAAVQEVLARLGDELERAFNSNPERNWLEYERARYVHALAAVAKFLDANTKSHDLSRRFYRLALALTDLNRGVVDPLLAVTPTGGINPGYDLRTWCARASVALGVHVLKVAGLTRKRAAKKAASYFREITETQILTWYDEFRKPADKSKIQNVARDIFEDGRQFVELAAQGLTAQNLNVFAQVHFSKARKSFGN